MHRIFPIIIAMLLLAPGAQASDRVLVASNLDDAASRAWGVYQNSDRENLLVYFAPRDGDLDGSTGATTLGQIQSVRMLGSRLPIAIAALGDRGYIVFPPVRSDGKRLMRVYNLRAIPSTVGGLWMLEPRERFDVEAPLISDSTLIGFQATTESVWALLRSEDGVELRCLTPQGWVDVPVPETISTRRLELHAIGSSPVLVDRSGLEFIGYRLDPEDVLWTTIPYRLPIARDTQIISGRNAMLVLDEDDEGATRLRLWSNDGIFVLASDAGFSRDASYTLLPTSSTLLGLRENQGEQDGDPIEMFEVNSRDASVRYSGAPSVTPPVSAEEFRFLVVMMVLVMSGVLVVVILPDRADSMHLPEGVVLADPGRRLIATMLDSVIVASAVGAVVGVSAADILTLAVIVQPDNSWSIFPLTIISGIIYSTLTEFLLAGTPGKLVARIRVVSAEPGLPHRPRLWSILVRNVIKWVLPPVAALALIDPEALHRGDRVSRSLVVMPRPASDPESR
jgi:uncharacterized RDD family membrane protein YckC